MADQALLSDRHGLLPCPKLQQALLGQGTASQDWCRCVPPSERYRLDLFRGGFMMILFAECVCMCVRLFVSVCVGL